MTAPRQEERSSHGSLLGSTERGASRRGTEINDIYDELLCDIFQIAQDLPPVLGGTSPRIDISHVSRRWRALSIALPTLWARIQITQHSKLAGLGEILSRSREHDLDIGIHLTVVGTTSSRRFRESLMLRDVMGLLIQQIVRWRSLDIITGRENLRNLLRYITGVSIPRLQTLNLVQTGLDAVSPVDIYCANTAFLAGVKNLAVHSSNLILNQNCLDTCGNMNVTGVHLQSSCMLHLRSLSLTGMDVIVPLHRSFDIASLEFLKLASFPGENQMTGSSFINLLDIFSSSTLQHLEIQGIVDSAWVFFMESLHSNNTPRFAGLQRLTLKSLQLRRMDINFALTFPSITHLHLENVHPEPLLQVLLRDDPPIQWLGLAVTVDELRIQLPSLSASNGVTFGP